MGPPARRRTPARARAGLELIHAIDIDTLTVAENSQLACCERGPGFVIGQRQRGDDRDPVIGCGDLAEIHLYVT